MANARSAKRIAVTSSGGRRQDVYLLQPSIVSAAAGLDVILVDLISVGRDATLYENGPDPGPCGPASGDASLLRKFSRSTRQCLS